jgi:GTP-binding protein HflX
LARTELLAEDRLFATLDPTVREIHNPHGKNILLTDTVGFIREIPHTLVEAFASTLEEITRADLLLVVFDAADTTASEQITIVESVLSDIGAAKLPRLYCANKCDMEHPPLPTNRTPLISVSALTGEGMPALIEMMHTLLAEERRMDYPDPAR